MKKFFSSILHLFFPNNCVACKNELFDGEKFICISCNLALPETNFHEVKNNKVEEILNSKSKISKASAFYFFSKEGKIQNLLHDIKYNDNKELAIFMGKKMAKNLDEKKWFLEIDAIIAIPLHKKKYEARGYNQSIEIAKGIAEITKIELQNLAIIRTKKTETQTKKNKMERMENVKDAFEIDVDFFKTKKHILLIDDVITTGATLNSCIDAIKLKTDVKISVLCLAAAIN